MAKLCMKQRNLKRKKLAKRYNTKRQALKMIVSDRARPAEERFEAQLQLQSLPKNSNPNRIRNICELTGRSRSYHRKFGMSRIKLRELASLGMIPGVTKSSW